MDYVKANKAQLWSETDSFTLDRYKQFAKKIKNPNIILDIGCNTGRGGLVLKKLFPNAEIMGLDIIEERLQKIPTNIYSKIFCSTVQEMQMQDNYFDAIVAGEVIEHIPPEDVSIFLRTCYRLLKKGGLLLLTTPNPKSFLVKLGRDAVFNDPSHVSIMNSKQLAELEKNEGFSKINVKGSGKAIRYIPEWFPMLNLFGSYLTIARK